MDKEYISIKDASKILNVTPLTLRNWDKNGKLIAHRHPINNYRIYLKEDIESIIKKIESGEKPIKHTKVEKSQEKTLEEKVVHTVGFVCLCEEENIKFNL